MYGRTVVDFSPRRNVRDVNSTLGSLPMSFENHSVLSTTELPGSGLWRGPLGQGNGLEILSFRSQELHLDNTNLFRTICAGKSKGSPESSFGLERIKPCLVCGSAKRGTQPRFEDFRKEGHHEKQRDHCIRLFVSQKIGYVSYVRRHASLTAYPNVELAMLFAIFDLTSRLFKLQVTLRAHPQETPTGRLLNSLSFEVHPGR